MLRGQEFVQLRGELNAHRLCIRFPTTQRERLGVAPALMSADRIRALPVGKVTWEQPTTREWSADRRASGGGELERSPLEAADTSVQKKGQTVINKPTKALLCGALLASVLPAIEQTASADPGELFIVATTVNPATGGASSIVQGYHTFGTTGTNIGGTWYVDVSSGPSQRVGWDYELTANWDPFDPESFFPEYSQGYLYIYIKEAGTTTPISAVNVKDVNGNDIAFNVEAGSGPGTIAITFDLFGLINTTGSHIMSVQWNQVPAPGALALLGVAGLVGKRRRR